MARFCPMDVGNAFLFVSPAGYGDNAAVLCKDNGKIPHKAAAT